MPVGKESILRAVNSKAKATVANNIDREASVLEINLNCLKLLEGRELPKENITLTNSIKKFGLIKPLIVFNINNELMLISGYSRVVSLLKITTVKPKALIININKEDSDKIIKEVNSFKKTKTAENFNIHEEKFKVIRGISSNLPDYLL